jgi:hypothetical protein
MTLATVKSTPQTHKGSSVVFEQIADLAPVHHAADGDGRRHPRGDVGLAGHGHARRVRQRHRVTAKVIQTSFIAFNPIAADVVGYNAGISMDTVVANVLWPRHERHLRRDPHVAGHARRDRHDHVVEGPVRVREALVGNNVMPFDDGYYRAVIHPDVAYDLKEETGDIGWRQVHNYSLPGDIVNGDIGAYEGFRWTVSPRAPIFADGGSAAPSTSTRACSSARRPSRRRTRRARTATGSSSARDPIVVKGPFTDNLYRFAKLGWYWFGGYGIFRQSALYRLETAPRSAPTPDPRSWPAPLPRGRATTR